MLAVYHKATWLKLSIVMLSVKEGQKSFLCHTFFVNTILDGWHLELPLVNILLGVLRHTLL